MKNKQTFEKYQFLKRDILEIASHSTPPDPYIALEDALKEVEKCLRVSLLHENS